MTKSNSAVPAPCGYCRRCLLHDDPAGCLVVEAWERENPEAAAAAYAPWYRKLLAERAEQDRGES